MKHGSDWVVYAVYGFMWACIIMMFMPELGTKVRRLCVRLLQKRSSGTRQG